MPECEIYARMCALLGLYPRVLNSVDRCGTTMRRLLAAHVPEMGIMPESIPKLDTGGER